MIKNFIYLDEEKMYSLSSQIFEGVTEYYLNEKSDESENSESQKGEFASGRILGDILRQVDKKTEKRFLNDFSYTLFEEKLLNDEKVIIADDDVSIENLCNKAESLRFIKITAKIIFNDMKSIKDMLKNINNLGLAITYLENSDSINEINTQLSQTKNSVKDRNQSNKVANINKSTKSLIVNLAKEKGLHFSQDFIDNISFILDYFFQDQLEVQMNLVDSIVSANLKRECLREREELIIKKYSRRTECKFVMFGIITQYKRDNLTTAKSNNFSSIKEHLMQIVEGLSTVEENFIGLLDNEIIIDPIALYTEL